jgi:HEAT repeat protein
MARAVLALSGVGNIIIECVLPVRRPERKSGGGRMGRYTGKAGVAALSLAALVSVLGCGGNEKIAYRELLDEDPQIRSDAARRLGQARSVAALDSLIAVVDDPSEMVRVEAILALGEIGDPRAVPAVVSRADDQLNTVKFAVCQALEKIGDPSAIETLERLLHDPNDKIRNGAAVALGQIEDPAALQVLIDVALRDENEAVREHVIKVVARVGARQFVPTIEDALVAETDLVRANAALTLGKIGDASSVPTLIAGLDDPYFKVRSLCAHSLMSLDPDSTEVHDAIRKRLEIEENGMARVDLAWNLAKAGDRSSMGVIREMLFKGEPEDVRAAAAMALGEVGDESDIERLERAMNDKKGLVKRQAYLALLKLKEA